MTLPSLFLSHGAPTLPLDDVPARHFLAALADQLPEAPRAILVISAHWESDRPSVNAVDVNETIHDFYGFPPALYALRYPAPGSLALAERVAELLERGGMTPEYDRSRGLDHGAWVPLLLAWPDADIPVVQLSVQTALGAAHHLRLGELLAPLREEGILIVGSGSFTHDLSSFRAYRDAADVPEPEFVARFADWMDDRIRAGDDDALADYRTRAPFAQRNHPTEEHILPLFVAMAAAGGQVPRRLHSSLTHKVLRMDVYAFG